MGRYKGDEAKVAAEKAYQMVRSGRMSKTAAARAVGLSPSYVGTYCALRGIPPGITDAGWKAREENRTRQELGARLRVCEEALRRIADLIAHLTVDVPGDVRAETAIQIARDALGPDDGDR